MGVYANINGSLVTISGMPPDMTGATDNTPGVHGLVPAPLSADRNEFLRGDGTWGDNNFIGTIDEWNALSLVNKLKYKTADITEGIVPPTTYTITYNANGGSGSMTVDTKIEDESYIIEDNGFTPPSGKIFLEWNTSADGSGTTYHADDTYTTNADLVLYAVWNVVALKFSSDGNFVLSTSDRFWDGTLQYSTDNGNNWSTWNGSQLSGTASQPIYLRGINNIQIAGENCIGWTFTGKYCTGNIETLLDYQTVINGQHPTMNNNGCFANMFYGCSSLITPPELPAISLAYGCYQNMFKNCTSLTEVPELPATILAEHCYDGMFSGCTSLSVLPKLSANVLMDYCYRRMFYNCSSIKLSATQTGEYQYPYRIPTSGDWTHEGDIPIAEDMFANTGGTVTVPFGFGTIYYTDHQSV